MLLSRVDPLGFRLTAAVLRGGGATAGCPFRVLLGACALANKILLVLSPLAPITWRQVLCNIFSPIQRPTRTNHRERGRVDSPPFLDPVGWTVQSKISDDDNAPNAANILSMPSSVFLVTGFHFTLQYRVGQLFLSQLIYIYISKIL
jgi:hypothetical protein